MKIFELTVRKRKPSKVRNERRSSNWLILVPISELNYVLNKKQFWDSIRLRYGWPIPRLLVSCSSCKKERLFTLRHNKVIDVKATLLSNVCKDVELEASL